MADFRFDTLREHSRKYVLEILHACGQNKRKAARVLGISVNTVKGYLRESLPKVTMEELLASVQASSETPEKERVA